MGEKLIPLFLFLQAMKSKVSSDLPLYVAITGGIGTGKSIVAKVFEKNGAQVFRADDVAKDLMRSDPVVREALQVNFGKKAYTAFGDLDTKYIASQVFGDSEKLTVLNSIVHPAVQRSLDEAMEKSSAPMFVMDAALVYEVGIEDLFDYIVVVDAEENTRIERVAQREGMAVKEVQQRMESQISQSEKADAADFVLANNGTPEELEIAAAELHALIMHLPKRNTLEQLETI